MPYPSRIDPDTLIRLAREMIEREGADKLSLHEIARALGVKTPSLYRYVASKTELLRAVNEGTMRALLGTLHTAMSSPGTPEERLLIVSRAYRDFVRANPATYGLLYTNTIAELRPDPGEAEQGALPLQALMAEVSGEADSLPALRGLWALLHGYTSLELAEQFQRGGYLDVTFEQAVLGYIRGWRQDRD